ncbi:hypothetical protein DPEC_G00002090 [Dallia pectoralis]|uniref:Uncharacterized protein n=1 Tax=Dallia pectoralis TaxID=75939 RepID=A0ACC2HIX8_DALPE|nr:hypothetical protein DPEC_G00002090 [Dallia pectoralis]
MLSFSTARVQEWLCLNCQMKRALGIDMTTPRSKSQQQIHSPSHQAKPIVQPQPVHQQALRSTFRMAREDQVVPDSLGSPILEQSLWWAWPRLSLSQTWAEAPLCIRAAAKPQAQAPPLHIVLLPPKCNPRRMA